MGATSRKVLEIIFNLKHHYIWGRPNWQFGADFIWKMNLSQKWGDLRFIEIITSTVQIQIPFF